MLLHRGVGHDQHPRDLAYGRRLGENFVGQDRPAQRHEDVPFPASQFGELGHGLGKFLPKGKASLTPILTFPGITTAALEA
jgi:hypothetical protein